MINFQNKKQCVGCGACESVCPQKCIHLKADEEGFLYPVVDSKRCTGCNLCDKVCLINKESGCNKELSFAFAGKNMDIDTRRNSSSGGVFYELAKCVLEQGGLVYGVTFDEELSVKHRCVASISELQTLCGSKYLPTKAGIVFDEVKKYVLENRLVLFSGTPCQVSSLLTFLGKTYSNLITIAVACHGVPSMKVWDKYKEYLQEKHSSKITRFTFRDKKTGWHNYSVEAKFENGNIYSSEFSKDPYMKSFVGNISLRLSCYKCKFRGKHAEADIILGDFWGIKHMVEGFDDNKGTSLIIIHTETGEKLFGDISSKIKLQSVEYDKAMKSNLALVKSPILMRTRRCFFDNFSNMDFVDAVEKYTKPPLWKKILIVTVNSYLNIKYLLKQKK